MIKRYAILCLVLAAALLPFARAAADHRVYLPALPTPAIGHLLTHEAMTYCLNDGGENYPNFATQVVDVFAAFEAEFGLTFTKVPWAGGNCQYMLAMREFPYASRAAARIFYANWPAIAEFRPSLGFWRWNSAIAHETGHLLGLHEQYMDSQGLIGCDANAESSLARLGFATMMSCGTFISVPTDRDKERVCERFPFGGCAPAVEPTAGPDAHKRHRPRRPPSAPVVYADNSAAESTTIGTQRLRAAVDLHRQQSHAGGGADTGGGA